MFWFFIGFLAKLVGKNGVWYAKCRQASLTDDVTGTMPPFDKCIVYGPAEPDKVVENIKQRMGCYGAVVADVNDLKRSAVLGHSKGLNPKEIAEILIDNCCARIKWERMLASTWLVGLMAGFLNIAFLMYFK